MSSMQENSVENLNFVEVLQDILGCDHEKASRIIAEKQYNVLRVVDVKSFLNRFRGQYHVSTNYNKAQLIVEMEQFISNPQSRKRQQPPYYNGANYYANAHMAPTPRQFAPLMQTTTAYSSPVPTHPQFDNSEDEEEYLYQQLYHPAQPKVHPLLQRPEAASMINELRQYGFSLEQIVAGMELHPHCLHADTLMLAIIGLEEQKEMNADIDLAIIASEQEREAIQDRKRRRVHVLQEDVSEHLLEIDEFQNSILLGRKRIASSDSEKHKYGSSVLIELVKLIESPEFIAECAVDSSCGTSSCVLPSPIVSVRKALVSLLLSERDALRWYKEDACNYFLHLQQRIDEALLLPQTQASLPDAATFLAREKENLDVVLLSMPETPGAVPLGFRQLNTCGTTCTSKDFSLDDDGIEIIK